MIALGELNRMYDGLLAYMKLHIALGNGQPHYVADKTRALIKHDRILTDMVEPTGRTGECEYQRQLARIRMDKIRAFKQAPMKRMRTISHLFLD